MKTLRVCILVHGPETRPEALLEWAFDQGHAIDLRRLDLGELLPTLNEFDFLIATGGPMNCYEDADYPFLAEETKLLKQALDAGKGVLGLCLGAQLMARATGAEVSKNAHWEAGWHTVHVDDPYLGKANLVVFQWHQDTFAEPPGSRRIATNAATKNQAFRLSNRAVGVQFHPEATHEWVRHCSVQPQYPTGLFVQDGSELVQGLIHLPAMNYWLRRLLHQIEGDL